MNSLSDVRAEQSDTAILIAVVELVCNCQMTSEPHNSNSPAFTVSLERISTIKSESAGLHFPVKDTPNTAIINSGIGVARHQYKINILNVDIIICGDIKLAVALFLTGR